MKYILALLALTAMVATYELPEEVEADLDRLDAHLTNMEEAQPGESYTAAISIPCT